ncbi:MAG TPA: phosphatase PAP2 family protein [Anaerolineales bacterium]
MKSILEIDDRLSRDLGVAEKAGLLRNIAIFFAHSGDSWFWGVALLILWMLGNAFWRQWAVVVLGSIGVLALLVFPVKQIIRRRRPEGLWGMIYRKTDPHSFPSGHAARAFLIAVLATGLGPSWLAPLLWIWAPLVALARVAMGVHYLSDILGGLILGLLAGFLVLHFLPALLAFLTAFFPWLF